MATHSDTERPKGAPPRWLLPALVGALIAGAALLAVMITGQTPTAQAPAAQPPLDQPLDQAPAAQAPAQAAPDGPSTGAAAAEEPAHGGLNPEGPQVQVIGLADARARFDAGTALFIDVRSGSEYGAGHIPGALTITSQELESRIQSAPAGTVIIAYGDASRPESGQRGAQIFMELGYPAVIALDGGFQAWRDAGNPVQSNQ